MAMYVRCKIIGVTHIVSGVEDNRVVVDLSLFEGLYQPSKLPVKHRESTEVVWVVLVPAPELGHGWVGLVDGVKRQVPVEVLAAGQRLGHEGDEAIDDESGVVARHAAVADGVGLGTTVVMQAGDPTRVARIGIEIVRARVRPVASKATTHHALIAV
eukprot:COSAG01_NODE_22649_length_847_cov_0.822193_2_plen_157_part_00